jgi:hypothetical protein
MENNRGEEEGAEPYEYMALLGVEEDVPEFVLLRWDNARTFYSSWTTLLLSIQGSMEILQRIPLEDRPKLFHLIRLCRKSSHTLDLWNAYAGILVKNGEQSVCRLCFREDKLEGVHEWLLYDIQVAHRTFLEAQQPEESIDTYNAITQTIVVCGECVGTILFMFMVGWIITHIQIV